MQRLLVASAVLVLVAAKPELYKEKEDFQYSRSSTDDGSKSGYYGAQRGNMGGNYERAHNMDLLAQHQMNGLVKQVEGELGDGAQTRTGSVFTSGNSRGVYGSGRYDLSGLKGRHFEETDSAIADDQLRSMSSYNSAYNAQAENSRYQSANSGYQSAQSHLNSNALEEEKVLNGVKIPAYAPQPTHNSEGSWFANRQAHNSRHQTNEMSESSQYVNRQSNRESFDSTESLGYSNIRAPTTTRAPGTYALEQGALKGDRFGYMGQGSQSGYRSQAVYDSQNYANSYKNSNTNDYRSDLKTHVIAGEPAHIIIRPGSTVAVPVAAQIYDANHVSLAHDQNDIHSETEVLNSVAPHSNIPVPGSKHYESSYSYRKEWEKHHTIPVAAVPLAIPTENPFLAERQFPASQYTQQSAYKSSAKSAKSRQTNYDANYHTNLRDLNLKSGYTRSATNADDAATSETVDMKPKSYHSSYSYHKSWERQGDPYIIYPATNGNNAQIQSLRTSNAQNQDYSSHQYASQYAQKNQRYSSYGSEDCDENRRVARSVPQNQYAQWPQNLEDQHMSQNLENLEQENQNLYNLHQGQYTQNLQDLKQLNQNLEDFGQQTQNLQDFKQYYQNLEVLGQQTQNFNNYNGHLEDFGQHTQNLQDLSHYNQNLEHLGQQTLNLNQHSGHMEDPGQQTQELLWKDMELYQQNQRPGQKPESSSYVQNQRNHGSLLNFDQQTQENWNDQQTQGTWNGQQTQDNWNNPHSWNNDEGQQQETQDSWRTNDGQVSYGSNQFDNNGYKYSENNEISQNSQGVNYEQNAEHSHDIRNNNITSQNTEQSQSTQVNDNSWSLSNQQTQQSYNKFHSSYEHNWNLTTFSNNSFKAVNNSRTETTNRSNTSLQNLWDKLNKLHQVHSVSDRDYFNNQNENRWKNISQTDESQFVPIQFLTSSTTVNPSTIETPTIENIDLNKNIRPQDIGRGDIGEEELLVPNQIENKPTLSYHMDKPFKTLEEIDSLSLTKQNETNTANFDSNQHSTNIKKNEYEQENQESLGVLSLDKQKQSENKLNTSSKHKDHMISSSNSNESQKSDLNPDITMYQNAEQQFENQENVNQQNENLQQQQQNPWSQNLQDFNQQELAAWKPNHKKHFNYINEQSAVVDQKSENLKQQQQNSWSPNVQDFNQQEQTDWKPSHENNFHYINGQIAVVDQQSENLEQQQQNTWSYNLQDFKQQEQAAWKAGAENQNHFNGQGVIIDQQNENLEQQQQTTMEQNLQDFNQQEQILKSSDKNQRTILESSRKLENLGQQEYSAPLGFVQQSDIQQQESLGRSNYEQLESQDFYNQRYPERLETSQQIQGLESSNKLVEMFTTTTEKPGFWKSVGNKFSNAKEKVVSWWKSY